MDGIVAQLNSLKLGASSQVVSLKINHFVMLLYKMLQEKEPKYFDNAASFENPETTFPFKLEEFDPLPSHFNEKLQMVMEFGNVSESVGLLAFRRKNFSSDDALEYIITLSPDDKQRINEFHERVKQCWCCTDFYRRLIIEFKQNSIKLRLLRTPAKRKFQQQKQMPEKF